MAELSAFPNSYVAFLGVVITLNVATKTLGSNSEPWIFLKNI